MKKVMISIKGSPILSFTEDDCFELLTDGEYLSKDGVSTFSYRESELTGLDGLLTTFNVEQDRVVLKRGGEYSSDMIFCENQKHNFLYETPFGSIIMGIDTHSIEKNLRDDGGSLEIRYDIEVDNVSVSQNLFQIDITSLPQ
jgi:uncharacterized beta-barrel protein YwiB (DUF1934 family)